MTCSVLMLVGGCSKHSLKPSFSLLRENLRCLLGPSPYLSFHFNLWAIQSVNAMFSVLASTEHGQMPSEMLCYQRRACFPLRSYVASVTWAGWLAVQKLQQPAAEELWEAPGTKGLWLYAGTEEDHSHLQDQWRGKWRCFFLTAHWSLSRCMPN